MENLKAVLSTTAPSKGSKGRGENLIESILHSKRHKAELLNEWGERGGSEGVNDDGDGDDDERVVFTPRREILSRL